MYLGPLSLCVSRAGIVDRGLKLRGVVEHSHDECPEYGRRRRPRPGPHPQGHGVEIVRCREERGRFTNLCQFNEVPGPAGKTEGVAVTVTGGGGPE